MFVISIEGEMVKSFTGELGNMVTGNLCTVLENNGLVLDISPPTVMKAIRTFMVLKRHLNFPLN